MALPCGFVFKNTKSKYQITKKSQIQAVTPAKAGVQKWLIFLDSRLRGNDENGCLLTFYEFVNIQ